MRILTLALLVGLFGTAAQAQKARKSPKSVLQQTVGLTEITVTYFRPSLKGRKLDKLAPNGKVWRTGANNATEVTFSNAVTLGGKDIAAGTYSLYSIPGDGEWTIILNSKLSWGTQYDESQDVHRFSANASKGGAGVETFTINVTDISDNNTDANIELAWADVSVKFPITVSK